MTDEYRREATTGSFLVPLLAAWLAAVGGRNELKVLMGLKADLLSHCTLQFWIPETASEKHFYLNDSEHGETLTDVALTEDGQEMLNILMAETQKSDGFSALSAFRAGYYPVLLTACRHYRLPVPPQIWISLLVSEPAPAAV